jgi:catechol-2,3-dioxygenase
MLMQAGSLHHLELNVSDLARSAELWGWLLEKLGYKPSESWKGGKSWRLHDSYIILLQVQEQHRYAGYHRRRIGLNHVAFRVQSVTELHELRKELQERNIPTLYADQYPHASGPQHVALYLEDPDRIKIELVVSAGDLSGAHAANTD